MTLCTIRVRVNRNWSTKAGSATDLVVQIMSAYELGRIVKNCADSIPNYLRVATYVHPSLPLQSSFHCTLHAFNPLPICREQRRNNIAI